MARPSSQHPSYRAPCAAQGPKLQELEAPTVTRTTGCSLHSFIFAAASLQTSPCDSTTSCAHRPQQRTGVTGPPDLHPLPSRIRQCSGKCRRSPSHPGYHTTMCSTEHRQHWAGPSPAQPSPPAPTASALLCFQHRALISPSLGTEIMVGQSAGWQALRAWPWGGFSTKERSAPPAPGARGC